MVHMYTTRVLCTRTNDRAFRSHKEGGRVSWGNLAVSSCVYEFLEHLLC